MFLSLKIDLKLGGLGQQVIGVRVSFRPSVKIVYCRGIKCMLNKNGHLLAKDRVGSCLSSVIFL